MQKNVKETKSKKWAVSPPIKTKNKYDKYIAKFDLSSIRRSGHLRAGASGDSAVRGLFRVAMICRIKDTRYFTKKIENRARRVDDDTTKKRASKAREESCSLGSSERKTP